MPPKYRISCRIRLAGINRLRLGSMQPKDLKATEIAELLSRNGSKRCNMLFDFTNMINAYETPVSALKTAAPYIRQVHVKGGKRIDRPGGWAHKAAALGSVGDQITSIRLIYELLMLGDPDSRGIKTFMRPPPVRDTQDVDFAVIGVPWEGGATFRSSQRSASDQIRKMSHLKTLITNQTVSDSCLV